MIEKLKEGIFINTQLNRSISTSQDWHAQSIETIYKSLETSAEGLSKEEASQRVTQYGHNRLPKPKTRSAFIRFLYQFHNILIYVLIAVNIVTAVLGHWVDTGVIIAVVLLNALKAIQQMLSPHTTKATIQN